MAISLLFIVFYRTGVFLRDGGGGRIRTFEVDDGRFTVCSLWPLGNPTTEFVVFVTKILGRICGANLIEGSYLPLKWLILIPNAEST